MLDSNTHYLNEYEVNSALLEQQWQVSLPEKQEAVVELAIKLIKQEAVTELFDWVFSEYIEDGEETSEHLYWVLECLTSGDTSDYYSESQVIQMALEGACKSSYDCGLDEITPHGTCGLIKQVLDGVK